MPLRTPQAKRRAVIRVERDRLVAELPDPVCTSRAGEVRCPREKLIERLRQYGFNKPPIEQGLQEVLDNLEDYTEYPVLTSFSIVVPYAPQTPQVKRADAAKLLKKALVKAGFEVHVEGSDTMTKYEVSAAA